MDDAAAMARMRTGDPSGLEHLYRRYFASLYRFAGRQCGDWHVAEDVVQDAFIHVFRYASTHRVGAPVAPWLFSIAYRVCLDRGRQAGREAARLAPVTAEAHQDPRTAEAAELQAPVAEALQMLAPGQRAAFLLHRVHGRSVREVAEILGCPEGTVKSRVNHAARALWRLLKRYLEEGGGCASRG